jgi:hypothetical protein
MGKNKNKHKVSPGLPTHPLVGRMNAKARPFERVVNDVRRAVCSVIRLRANAQGGFQAMAIGSGFFVSCRVFITCFHVLMHTSNPHRDGDRYELVANLGQAGGSVHSIANAVVGQNVHLFPTDDLAILIADGNQDRAYLPLFYEDIQVGAEIGVAGYPIPRLNVVNGMLNPRDLIYRVARSVVTATYNATINTDIGTTLPEIPVIEVNFLFVAGNSGGPIFSADTGRVMGFVHGFQGYKVLERVETVTMLQNLPAGMSNTYIHNQTALYSLGIVLSRIRSHLEGFGVTL